MVKSMKIIIADAKSLKEITSDKYLLGRVQLALINLVVRYTRAGHIKDTCLLTAFGSLFLCRDIHDYERLVFPSGL